ncbi:MAG: AAA family ATPase [Muribaculaceae bacterium]|nr:AAA family ATPase [Muribaculaceae bacterium]
MKDDYMPVDAMPTVKELDVLLRDFEEKCSFNQNDVCPGVMPEAACPAGYGEEADGRTAFDQLMEMEGLESVKEAIRTQLCYAKIMNMRRELGFKAPRRVFNVILTGNPGTGKTTVARLIGRIFREAGLLSKGHTVETNRAGLVGRYIGDSEANTRTKIEEARGGVLMIDEMYALTSEVPEGGSETRDFGVKVIDTLMTVLSDPAADMIVIGCGYRKEMDHFLKANPGLASRFPMVLDFEDFSADQLWAITRRRLMEFDFIVSDEGEKAIRELIGQASAVKNFGNGRFAVTLAENYLIPALCSRIFKAWRSGAMSAGRMKKLSVVEKSDVPELEVMFPLAGRARGRVGFK